MVWPKADKPVFDVTDPNDKFTFPTMDQESISQSLPHSKQAQILSQTVSPLLVNITLITDLITSP